MFIYSVSVANWRIVIVVTRIFVVDFVVVVCSSLNISSHTYSCLRHVATLSKHLKQVKLPCRITNLFFTNTDRHSTQRQIHVLSADTQ